nr:unnamed protein product [Digitaria exilis]
MTKQQVMPILVTKNSPICIRPSSPTTPVTPATNNAAAVVALSSFDKCMPPVPITMLLVFDHPIVNPTETIKTSLSRALAHYPPIAGRLIGDVITCTDDGVTFVAASAAKSTLEEAMAVLPQTDLAIGYPNPRCHGGADEPLLLMQVTEFACGGFVVAVTWNHLLADAAGMAQFVHAVGELARGGGISVSPSVRLWDDVSLPGVPSSAIAAQRSTLDFDPLPLARLDVVVLSTLISRVKAAAGEFAGGEPPCTVFEAVAAVLWRCRVRAVMSSSAGDDSPAPLTIPCNVRKLAGAPVGYYGNCVVMLVVPAAAGVIANSDVGDLVRMIRSAKAKVVEGKEEAAPAVWYEALAVSSWRNMGMEATDMGGGAPVRVTWQPERTMVPACVVCPPRRDGREDGSVDVSSMFVREGHVDAFKDELARMIDDGSEE